MELAHGVFLLFLFPVGFLGGVRRVWIDWQGVRADVCLGTVGKVDEPVFLEGGYDGGVSIIL